MHAGMARVIDIITVGDALSVNNDLFLSSLPYFSRHHFVISLCGFYQTVTNVLPPVCCVFGTVSGKHNDQVCIIIALDFAPLHSPLTTYILSH